VLAARRYLIRGRVQGVGFRFFAFDEARREGLSGYVRNLPDGGVEALAEGDREALLRFELSLRRGPRGARVEAVDVEELSPTSRHTGFSVRG
jgi:acylphosphatase